MTETETTAPQFESFGKIPRLFGDVVVTEKIDGTNAQICITEDGDFFVGSRNRWLTCESDNFGFCNWATAHKQELLELGPGRHYGEWWGSGIQRGYGLPKGEKRFSLFNVGRWLKPVQPGDYWYPRSESEDLKAPPDCCHVVPVLHIGSFDSSAIEAASLLLYTHGSAAAGGFMNPEGVMIYHMRAGVYFKAPFDPAPKGVQTNG